MQDRKTIVFTYLHLYSIIVILIFVVVKNIISHFEHIFRKK